MFLQNLLEFQEKSQTPTVRHYSSLILKFVMEISKFLCQFDLCINKGDVTLRNFSDLT